MNVSITRRRRGYLLETEQTLPHPREAVFDFFADAGNLDEITPPELRFRILTPLPITMREGCLIDYRIHLSGLPVRWRTEITAWEPPFRFVDSQRRGPYRWWIHEHQFVDAGDDTIVRDVVDYGVPGGSPVHALIVRRRLLRIFEYRRSVMARRFATAPRTQPASM